MVRDWATGHYNERTQLGASTSVSKQAIGHRRSTRTGSTAGRAGAVTAAGVLPVVRTLTSAVTSR